MVFWRKYINLYNYMNVCICLVNYSKNLIQSTVHVHALLKISLISFRLLFPLTILFLTFWGYFSTCVWLYKGWLRFHFRKLIVIFPFWKTWVELSSATHPATTRARSEKSEQWVLFCYMTDTACSLKSGKRQIFFISIKNKTFYSRLILHTAG